MPATPIDPAEPDRDYLPLRRAASGLRLMRCTCTAGIDAPAPEERHEGCTITLIERGSLGYRTVAGKAHLTPGWLMLGNPGDGYTCSHALGDGSGDDCIFLSIPAPMLEDSLGALGLPGTRPRFEQAALPPLPRVAALLANLLADGDEGFALEEGTLAVVGAVHSAISHRPVPLAGALQEERARSAASCIESRAAEQLSIDDVAQSVGVGSFHLMRSFKRSIGVTPHQYLMRIRLLRAIDLLRDTSLPVTDVAYESGWADLSNFVRTFRRDVGCTPGDFRRGGKSLLKGEGSANGAARSGSRARYPQGAG
jgi:AraC family transcriptional regulator